MEAAAAEMGPAADKLKGQKWSDALEPENKALQHLSRAMATFRDIQVARGQQGGGGGGGGGGEDAGRDLANLFDLELDTEKNQYESQQSSSGRQAAAGRGRGHAEAGAAGSPTAAAGAAEPEQQAAGQRRPALGARAAPPRGGRPEEAAPASPAAATTEWAANEPQRAAVLARAASQSQGQEQGRPAERLQPATADSAHDGSTAASAERSARFSTSAAEWRSGPGRCRRAPRRRAVERSPRYRGSDEAPGYGRSVGRSPAARRSGRRSAEGTGESLEAVRSGQLQGRQGRDWSKPAAIQSAGIRTGQEPGGSEEAGTGHPAVGSGSARYATGRFDEASRRSQRDPAERRRAPDAVFVGIYPPGPRRSSEPVGMAASGESRDGYHARRRSPGAASIERRNQAGRREE